ncbi:MAG: LysR family transcriptional regulator [Hyphomicrobiales bacterium]|nr:LysR family transcriptional regulator [Hyphomicrobiales bacterium]MCP5000811.1 LysR family transcriptional regulator [Hyphomicrobiales bacterium]
MNWQTITFDWNQARAFLVTAEEGSLSAAARALGLTQPTLGRQVAGLEEELGVTLFERVGRSLSLTQPGLELLDHFRTMGEAASRISLAASGKSQAIEGQVSITATNMMATYNLPSILERLRDIAPGIEIEIIASNDVRDLTRREADIAIRHVRPEQPDLIARLVSEMTAQLYASKDYLDRFGRPEKPEDLSGAQFIGFGQSDRLLPVFNGLGLSLTTRNFKLTTASGTVILALVRQGLGISIVTDDLAEVNPDLELVLPQLDPIPVPVWLVTHRELHTSRRIRLVFDLLAEALGS